MRYCELLCYPIALPDHASVGVYDIRFDRFGYPLNVTEAVMLSFQEVKQSPEIQPSSLGINTLGYSDRIITDARPVQSLRQLLMQLWACCSHLHAFTYESFGQIQEREG